MMLQQVRNEHNELQIELINTLNEIVAFGGSLDAEGIADMLDLEQNNKIIFDWIKKNSKIPMKEIWSAIHARRVKDRLGCMPTSASHYVELYAAEKRLEVKFNGMIERDPSPFIVKKDGKKEPIPYHEFDELVKGCDEVAFTLKIQFPREVTRSEFERELRILRDELKIPYSDTSISDAFAAVYEFKKRNRLGDIYSNIASEFSHLKKEDDATLVELCRRVFDEENPAFAAAVLQKFIWQVKRKIKNLPVSRHLMPVLLGAQNKGKSTFVDKLISPLSELSRAVSFKDIEDDRQIDLWNSYIFVLDEMDKASKSDVDTVKNVITASTLTRRPMRTNSTETIRQCATLIGTSNKELSQLIKDNTGARRFAPLNWSNNPDFDFINGIDWVRIWRSVEAESGDPMQPFMAELEERQEEARDIGPVEMWLKSIREENSEFHIGQKISAKDLYQSFSDYEHRNFGSRFNLTLTAWGSEIGRLMKLQKSGFEKKRSSTGYIYVYVG